MSNIVIINTGNGNFLSVKRAVEIYESNSVGGKETQNKINNRENIMKKMLATKYDDLMEKN